MNRLQIHQKRQEVLKIDFILFYIFYKIFYFLFLATDSSVDSSSDEHLQNQCESSTTLQNVNSSTHHYHQQQQPQQQQQQQNSGTLQRKVSDRKAKRVRAKQNDITGLTSSTEILKKGD